MANRSVKYQFSIQYLLLTVLLLVIEIGIGSVGKHIYWLRAFGGDVLVVILLYTFIRTFLILPKKPLVGGIFVFAVLVEFAQYFKLATHLGFKPGSVMYIVLGNSFSWGDIACYTVGCAAILLCSVSFRRLFFKEK